MKQNNIKACHLYASYFLYYAFHRLLLIFIVSNIARRIQHLSLIQKTYLILVNIYYFIYIYIENVYCVQCLEDVTVELRSSLPFLLQLSLDSLPQTRFFECSLLISNIDVSVIEFDGPINQQYYVHQNATNEFDSVN